MFLPLLKDQRTRHSDDGRLQKVAEEKAERDSGTGEVRERVLALILSGLSLAVE